MYRNFFLGFLTFAILGVVAMTCLDANEPNGKDHPAKTKKSTPPKKTVGKPAPAPVLVKINQVQPGNSAPKSSGGTTSPRGTLKLNPLVSGVLHHPSVTPQNAPGAGGKPQNGGGGMPQNGGGGGTVTTQNDPTNFGQNQAPVFNGDLGNISNQSFGVGTVTFNIDVNGDLFGSTHNGTVVCPGPITNVIAMYRDGGGHYDGNAIGDTFTWNTQCGSTAGIHYTITLTYQVPNQ